MRQFLLAIMVLACLVATTTDSASAQLPPVNRPAGLPGGNLNANPNSNPNAGFEPAMNRAPAGGSRMVGPVAVIDLLKVFDNHPGFQDKKMQMDRAKEAKEQSLMAQRDALKHKAESLKEFKPGTDEFSKLESECAADEAKLQIELKKANQEFIVAEGKMYYQTYTEVLDMVKWYAGQRNISMVIRFIGAEVHPENPEEVAKEMNELVVYYSDSIDITNDILAQIKSRYPARVGQAPHGRPQQQLRTR